MSKDDSPEYYNFSNIQPLDAAIAWGFDYLRGSALKYMVRAGKKTPDPREDINKAIFYLNRYVEEYDKWEQKKLKSTEKTKPTSDLKPYPQELAPDVMENDESENTALSVKMSSARPGEYLMTRGETPSLRERISRNSIKK